jgi:CRP/FNR family transcriptional regulator
MKEYLSKSSKLIERNAKGEKIFMQGEPFNGLFLIRSGVVRITQSDRDGRDFVFWMAGAGELIGLSSYFNGEYYLYSATAANEQCEVLRISANQLESVINNSLDAKKRLMKLLCQRIEFTENRTRQFIGRNGDDRLAETILFLAKNRSFSDIRGQKLVLIPYTYSDISDITGIKLTYLTKLMGKLKREGLCLPTKEGFVIDVARLSAVAKKPLVRKGNADVVG